MEHNGGKATCSEKPIIVMDLKAGEIVAAITGKAIIYAVFTNTHLPVSCIALNEK